MMLSSMQFSPCEYIVTAVVFQLRKFPVCAKVYQLSHSLRHGGGKSATSLKEEKGNNVMTLKWQCHQIFVIFSLHEFNIDNVGL